MTLEVTHPMTFDATSHGRSITTEGLTKRFEVGGSELMALGPMDVALEHGEFLVVVGPSGCGKTTLLRILAGLDEATSGTVRLHRRDGQDPQVAVVFQEDSVFPWMTVRENVGYGLRMQGRNSAEAAASVETWIERVGLTGFEAAYPSQLSGGMRQRVSIARALCMDPDILLMDEPFSALDEQTKTSMQQELLTLWESLETTVLFITHSVDEAIVLGDRIVVMSSRPGRVKESTLVPFSRPREVLDLRSRPEYGELLKRVWGSLRPEI